MTPVISPNFSAIFTAVLVSFIFGWLWHEVLFEKIWRPLAKKPTDLKPSSKEFAKSVILTLLGNFLMAYVLLYSMDIWRPSVWKVGRDLPDYWYGFFTAFYVWLGFYIPLLLRTTVWERKRWGLFFLDASFNFLNLQLVAMILAYWH